MGKLLIVGGGIGGLSAALACAKAGGQVELFERAPSFSEFGAGIQLGPNVVKVVRSWGLNDALAEVAAFPTRLQVRSALSGAELGTSRLGEISVQRYGAPYITIHRADLQNLLLAAVQQERGVSLYLDSPASGFSQDDSGVTLQLNDVQQVSGDVMVGADGGWSRIRQQLLHDGVPLPTGHLAYRTMVEQDSLPAHLRSQQVTAWLGPKLHVVQYPVRSGKWLNVVAIVHGRVQGDMSHWDHSANGDDLKRCMAKTCAPLRDLIDAIPSWRLWPLSIRPPMSGAHEHAKGRVALLGDAAHPMVPYLAQGAGMAIEDAAVLASVLSVGDFFTGSNRHSVPELLQQYAQQRWQRNARVQARAIRNGGIFHATGPKRWGRDVAMRLMGEALLDVPWLYGNKLLNI
jgi:salicylate hydroxylase